jgi:hypothetical protein
MKRLIIIAVGLALVVGIVVGGIGGNPFGGTAQRTSAAGETGGGCYTNWSNNTCAAGYTAVQTGVWVVVGLENSQGLAGPVCANPTSWTWNASYKLNAIGDFWRVSPYSHNINAEPCAICCATGASVVGGVAESPAVAGPMDTSGMGRATYAVLVGATAGVLAFAVLGTLAAKRRGVQQ